MSFAVDWWRGQGRPRAFQQTNIAIHCVATLFVFLFLLTCLRHWFPDEEGRSLMWAAAIAAAVWAAHPIQVQSVTYIVQRMTSLAALFKSI